ncbi:DsbA family protein [Nocardia otitidiscaviarum]|uniref:DsbA family protein n=1 Tax=Nocardia otitidiscaviarum TaxID=1823 RepID=UPI00245859CA|nr:thioredoxin domain-containing protein [Nocardia otitidiscaviarum]
MSNRSQRRARSTPAARPSARPAIAKIGAGLAVFAAVALLVIAISQIAHKRTEESARADAAATSTADDEIIRQLAALARRDAADPMARGAVDAPVVMIEYSDFQCPYCKQFAQHTEPDLVRRYLDSGQLRIEWRSMAFFGPESEVAARAAWAAGQQGRFWEMHDVLFAHSPEKKNTGAYTDDTVTEWAMRAGVADIAKFRADLNSDAARDAVDADMSEAIGIGVGSTPAFLINGRPILGARPVEQMIAVIEAGLRDREGVR